MTTILIACPFVAGAVAAPQATVPVRMVEHPSGDQRFEAALLINGCPVEVRTVIGSRALRGLFTPTATPQWECGPKITCCYGAATGSQARA